MKHLTPFVFCMLSISSFGQANLKENGVDFLLPKPNGKYQIGSVQFYAIDTSRFDSILNKNGRPILFQVWYPISTETIKYQPYISNSLYKAMNEDKYNNIDSLELLKWKRLYNHSSIDVPNFKGKQFPLLFFLHGFGMSQFSYTSIIERLVSQGFIVISLDSPHSGLMSLPDGTIIKTLFDNEPVTKCENMAKDVGFIYDWIKNTEDKKLKQLRKGINFKFAGILGHSLGGAAALEVCRINNAFKAVVNFDGDPWGKVEDVGFSKPTLILLNQPLVPDEHFSEPGSKEKWTEMGNARKKMWEDIINKNKSVPSFVVRITRTNHFSFTDFPFVTNEYYDQAKLPGKTMDKDKSLNIICAYTIQFFNNYLLRDASSTIKKLVDQFPETNLQLTSEK